MQGFHCKMLLYAPQLQHHRAPVRDVQCHESGFSSDCRTSLLTLSGHPQAAHQAAWTFEDVGHDQGHQRDLASADEGMQGGQSCLRSGEPAAVHQEGPGPARQARPSGKVQLKTTGAPVSGSPFLFGISCQTKSERGIFYFIFPVKPVLIDGCSFPADFFLCKPYGHKHFLLGLVDCVSHFEE